MQILHVEPLPCFLVEDMSPVSSLSRPGKPFVNNIPEQVISANLVSAEYVENENENEIIWNTCYFQISTCSPPLRAIFRFKPSYVVPHDYIFDGKIDNCGVFFYKEIVFCETLDTSH